MDALLARGKVAGGKVGAGVVCGIADVVVAIRFALAFDTSAFIAKIFPFDVTAVIIRDAGRAALRFAQGRSGVVAVGIFLATDAFVGVRIAKWRIAVAVAVFQAADTFHRFFIANGRIAIARGITRGLHSAPRAASVARASAHATGAASASIAIAWRATI